MERTQEQTWTELKTALDKLVGMHGTNPTIKEETQARHDVERLERELNVYEKKAA